MVRPRIMEYYNCGWHQSAGSKLMVTTVSAWQTMGQSFEKVSGADLTGREI
jgi:hypothetical protein